MNHVEFAVVFVAGLVTALLLAVAAWHWQRRRAATQASRHAVQRAARAQGGELDAEAQLATAGYAILQRQAHAIWAPRVDGVAEPFELRADFLVQDIESNDIFVAEVKTGDLAPELSTAATRRQLLEYQCAFGVTAVLLVWPERNQILRVEFPMPVPQPNTVDSEVSVAALIEVRDRHRTKSPWRLAACSVASLVLAGLLLQL
jgi:hypothetical protein